MGRTDYDYARLDNFFTARVFARYQVTDNVALHVRVENLFDQNFIITNDYNFGPRQARGLGVFRRCDGRILNSLPALIVDCIPIFRFADCFRRRKLSRAEDGDFLFHPDRI